MEPGQPATSGDPPPAAAAAAAEDALAAEDAATAQPEPAAVEADASAVADGVVGEEAPEEATADALTDMPADDSTDAVEQGAPAAPDSPEEAEDKDADDAEDIVSEEDVEEDGDETDEEANDPDTAHIPPIVVICHNKRFSALRKVKGTIKFAPLGGENAAEYYEAQLKFFIDLISTRMNIKHGSLFLPDLSLEFPFTDAVLLEGTSVSELYELYRLDPRNKDPMEFVLDTCWTSHLLSALRLKKVQSEMGGGNEDDAILIDDSSEDDGDGGGSGNGPAAAEAEPGASGGGQHGNVSSDGQGSPRRGNFARKHSSIGVPGRGSDEGGGTSNASDPVIIDSDDDDIAVDEGAAPTGAEQAVSTASIAAPPAAGNGDRVPLDAAVASADHGPEQSDDAPVLKRAKLNDQAAEAEAAIDGAGAASGGGEGGEDGGNRRAPAAPAAALAPSAAAWSNLD